MAIFEHGAEKQTAKLAEPSLPSDVYTQNLEDLFPQVARIARGEDPAKVMRENKGVDDFSFERPEASVQSKRHLKEPTAELWCKWAKMVW